MFKNKFYVISLIATVVIGFLLVVAQIPMAHTAPKDLPIAIMDGDQTPASAAIVDKLTTNMPVDKDGNAPIKWTRVKSEKAIITAMDQQKYYGALVIKKGFAQNTMTLATAQPQQPEVTVFINQAKNPTAATAVQNMLTMMTTQIGTGMANQVLDKLQALHLPVSTTTAKLLMSPLKTTVKTVHSTKDMTVASASFFQPIWMGALLGSLMLFFAQKGLVFKSKKQAWLGKLMQVVVMMVTSIAAGFGTTYFIQTILDYQYDNFVVVATFATLSAFALQLLMLGVVSWLGMGGVPIFAVLMLFAAPLTNLAPEMLSSFYNDWIMPWAPMHFLTDGMREIVFYDGGIWNNSTAGLVWMMIIGLILIGLSVYKPVKK